jgi:hypothetical protein
MTLNQLYELVPEARDDRNIVVAIDQNKREHLPGKLSVRFNGLVSPYNTIPRFQNINYLGLDFFNNQLTDLVVQYNWPSWNNANEFIAKLRESFALPAVETWEGSNDQKSIRCKDFVFHVNIQGGGAISIRDTTSNKKVDDLRKATIEKARKEFKP